MALHLASKILSPDKGYPCIYRNWRAETHCRNWHGYDLRFELYFSCETRYLTKEGWVVDFGSFGPLKDDLDTLFDHTWIIALDDPLLALSQAYTETATLNGHPCGDIVLLPSASAEAFAEHVAKLTRSFLDLSGRHAIDIREVIVRENGANAGGWIP